MKFRWKKLEEQNQQAADAEKRATDWAKTLETDLEKVHDDLSIQEHMNKLLKEKNQNLEENFKEIIYENEKLKQNIDPFESELKSFQNEINKISRNSIKNDFKIDAIYQ